MNELFDIFVDFLQVLKAGNQSDEIFALSLYIFVC